MAVQTWERPAKSDDGSSSASVAGHGNCCWRTRRDRSTPQPRRPFTEPARQGTEENIVRTAWIVGRDSVRRFCFRSCARPARLVPPMKARTLLPILALVAASGVVGSTFGQGTLTPPGAPLPTMKTLDQIEARTAIPGGSAPYTISAPGSYYLTGNLTPFRPPRIPPAAMASLSPAGAPTSPFSMAPSAAAVP